MGRNLNPKCKQCRRLKEKLFLKGERCNSAKCAIIKRNYPPGFHGPKGGGRQTEYGTQLQEKQKAKKIFNLLEKQFKLTFERAKKEKGEVGKNLLILLEMRLDNAIYKLGFASSIGMARQMIAHGVFMVNNQKVNIPSYQVKSGDIIKVRDNKKRLKMFEAFKKKSKILEVPGWLNLNTEKMIAKVLHAPKQEEIKNNINTQMIVEFYSR